MARDVEKFKTNIEVLKNSDFEEAVLSPLTRGSMDRPICTIYKNEIHCNHTLQQAIRLHFHFGSSEVLTKFKEKSNYKF